MAPSNISGWTIPKRLSKSASSFTIPILITHAEIGRGMKKFILVHALVDSGASCSFIDKKYVQDNGLPFVMKKGRVSALVADGRSVESGAITHETEPITVQITDHISTVVFNITQLTTLTPVIIGLSWLTQHNPLIDWRARQLRWNINLKCLQCRDSHALKKYRTPPVAFTVHAGIKFDVEEVLGFKVVEGRCFLQLRLESIVWEPIESVKMSCESIEDIDIYMKSGRPPRSTLEVYGKREFEVGALLGVRWEGGEYLIQVCLKSITWEPLANIKVNGNFFKMPKKLQIHC